MSTTYDLSMTRAQPMGAPAIQQLAGPNDPGQLITGGAKLAQNYTVILMTEKGSIPYATSRGSNFISIVRNSGGYSEGDILTAFAAAQLDISVQLAPNKSAPLDEQYASSKLTGITITSEGLTLNIVIVSAAGVGTTVILPITFTLQ